ncbi:NET1-associated nuclear protein 1 [Savitreella phatthalungensis]
MARAKAKGSRETAAAATQTTGQAGGRYSNLRPVFSTDSKYCFIATRTSVHVCNLAASAVVRQLHLDQPVTAFFLDPANLYRLVVITLDGGLTVFDWTDGALLETRTLQGDRVHFAAVNTAGTIIWSDGLSIHASSETEDTEVAEFADALGIVIVGERVNVWRAGGFITLSLEGTKATASSTTTFSGTAFQFAASQRHWAWADNTGVIHVAETDQSIARRLHWHASAVTALDFALDGEYLLSAGAEGVLVLWQLATTEKQFLPRVSPRGIDLLCVSPDSRSYAVKLDDNTFKFINAADLAQHAEIAGVRYEGNKLIACAAGSETAPVLLLGNGSEIQTWDLILGRSSSRTPIAPRTYAGKRPGGYRANEPYVVAHCAVGDGDDAWIVTSDVWQPPNEDLPSYGLARPSHDCQMKFFSRRQAQSADAAYTIVTRVDFPHGHSVVSQLLPLSSNSVLSVAQDGSMKFWHLRKGTWVCTRQLSLFMGAHKVKAALSRDRSLLAVHAREQTHLVDMATGVVKHVICQLGLGKKLVNLGFVGDRLLVLLGARKLVCYDLLRRENLWGLLMPQDSQRMHLAVSSKGNRFAVAIDSTPTTGKLFIWDAHTPKPTYREKVSKTLALVCAGSEIIQITADLRVCRYGGARVPALADAKGAPALLPAEDDGLSVHYRAAVPIESKEVPADMTKPVAHQRLQAIFDGSGTDALEKLEKFMALTLGG